MMVSLFRNAALRRGSRARRRIAIAGPPNVESLEERKLPTILVLPITSVPNFTATLELAGLAGNNIFEGVPVAAGNLFGTYGNTALSSTYGLNPEFGIDVGTSYYSATETNNATINGNAVANAGAITWLLVNFGPTATTVLDQDALQAAIWRTEFGENFELDGVDNSVPISPSSVNAQIAATYQADLAALGSNTLPVSDALWISPFSSAIPQSSQAEGLVALDPGPAPAQTASTQIAVTSSVTPAALGQAVTIGAAVTNLDSQGGTPTGSVQFQVDGTNFGKPIPLSPTGTAALVGTKLDVGVHTVDAVYIPSGSFTTSTSPRYMQTITPDVTSTIVTSSANRSRKGKAVNFSVTVADDSPLGSAVPRGTVVLKIDGQTRASAALSHDKAVFKGIKLAAGTHTVTVYYTPLDASFAASEGELVTGERVK